VISVNCEDASAAHRSKPTRPVESSCRPSRYRRGINSEKQSEPRFFRSTPSRITLPPLFRTSTSFARGSIKSTALTKRSLGGYLSFDLPQHFSKRILYTVTIESGSGLPSTSRDSKGFFHRLAHRGTIHRTQVLRLSRQRPYFHLPLHLWHTGQVLREHRSRGPYGRSSPSDIPYLGVWVELWFDLHAPSTSRPVAV
jgi:hypothetical protein